MEEKRTILLSESKAIVRFRDGCYHLKKEAVYFRAAKNTAGYKGYLRALAEKAPQLEHTLK